MAMLLLLAGDLAHKQEREREHLIASDPHELSTEERGERIATVGKYGTKMEVETDRRYNVGTLQYQKGTGEKTVAQRKKAALEGNM